MTKPKRQKNLTIRRYPPTSNKSLQAWNAGDDYILNRLDDMGIDGQSLAIYNDHFGYLSCYLSDIEPNIIVHRSSQKTSILMNASTNSLKIDESHIIRPFDSLPENIDIGLMQIPKSVDLFRFFLHQLSSTLSDDGIILCAFMTKYFTPALLEIAGSYFETVDQSLAWKKSRVLTLRGRKPLPDYEFIESYSHTFDGEHKQTLRQYPGVFSSGQVDYATQFLLDHLTAGSNENHIVDVGSGNGVISKAIQLNNPEARVHLVDDSILAIESSKLNLSEEGASFYWSDTLDVLDDQSMDLAVSNPPFHFGHETNIEISVNLFRDVAGVLKPGGRFICVANKHLGYQSHLRKFFQSAEVSSQNEKFVIYESRK